MLCQICNNIDLDRLYSKNGLLHHASKEALIESAKYGCDLCMLIVNYRDVAPWCPQMVPEDRTGFHGEQILAWADKNQTIVRFWQPNHIDEKGYVQVILRYHTKRGSALRISNISHANII